MLKIVVTFATPSEFAAWRRMAQFRLVNTSNPLIYVRRTADAEVLAVITGVGARSVMNGLRAVLSDGSDICIASGLAGSLRREHSAGAVLAARKVKTAGPERVVESDKSLFEIAGSCGADVVDCFWTSEGIVNTTAEKSRLARVADAVDMESFHVVRQAEQLGIPAIAVRAVSDGAETNMPMDFNRVIDDRGQIARAPALIEVAKAPHRIPALIRFGIESWRARTSLAHFLERFTTLLAAHQPTQLSSVRAEMR